MKPQGRATDRARALVAAAGLIVGLVLVVPTAQATSDASPAAKTVASRDTVAVATTLAARLGESHTAGFYLDRAMGGLVVTVTDSAAARTVRASGATPRFVARSGAQLRKVTGTLGHSARFAGTAWGVDPKLNKVVVFVDGSMTGGRLERLKAVIEPFGDVVRLHRVNAFGIRMSGGDPIYGGPYRCTAGVNVVSGNSYYFITAGHCGNTASSWYADAAHTSYIGPTASSSFPGNDYAIVRYSGSVSHEGTVGSQDITSAGNAYAGERVCMRGGTTGVHCGTVRG